MTPPSKLNGLTAGNGSNAFLSIRTPPRHREAPPFPSSPEEARRFFFDRGHAPGERKDESDEDREPGLERHITSLSQSLYLETSGTLLKIEALINPDAEKKYNLK
jgi:hypothetical protein